MKSKLPFEGKGKFKIRYPLLERQQFVLFVIAEQSPFMLANAIGTDQQVPHEIVVNERTTVVTGMTFAQLIEGEMIRGNTHGMINAVKMAENMANPKTSGDGDIPDIQLYGQHRCRMRRRSDDLLYPIYSHNTGWRSRDDYGTPSHREYDQISVGEP